MYIYIYIGIYLLFIALGFQTNVVNCGEAPAKCSVCQACAENPGKPVTRPGTMAFDLYEDDLRGAGFYTRGYCPGFCLGPECGPYVGCGVAVFTGGPTGDCRNIPLECFNCLTCGYGPCPDSCPEQCGQYTHCSDLLDHPEQAVRTLLPYRVSEAFPDDAPPIYTRQFRESVQNRRSTYGVPGGSQFIGFRFRN
eukprot:GHVL01021134.1.p1 GENE.GHVL01021134.1~~GHVL01021134.1.p1  ORF type:complete len:204 (+),score=41.21 GHVL01021134.1:32-613(+)